MRELRSTGNALFWFALFLLGYALVVPPPEGTGRGRRPRFLRMVIEESGTPGHREKVNITVLFEEMKQASRGDVIEVTSDDAHVKVVVD